LLSYILLNCSPGSEVEVISEISSLAGVIEVNGVFVKVSAENPDAMEMIVSQIRKIKVISSHTLPVVYGQDGTIDK